MPASCSALHCTNRFRKNVGRSFYRFPLNNDELCKKWVQATRRENWTPTKNSCLCSDHFEEKCFRYNNERRSLHANVVPTIFHFPPFEDDGDKQVGRKLDKIKMVHQLETTSEIESKGPEEKSLKNCITKDQLEIIGDSSICESSDNTVLKNSESKIVCKDYRIKACTTMQTNENFEKDNENVSSVSNAPPVNCQQPEKCLNKKNSERITSFEDVGEYELTVTEEALLRLHGLSISLPIPCDLCPPGTVFDDLNEFDVHMNDHPEAKMFACQLCNNTYKSWSNLVAHRKVFHLGEVLSCLECGTRRSHTRLEGAVHYPVGEKPHGCEECDIGLDTISDVYRHYWRHIGPPGFGGKLDFAITKHGRPTKRTRGGSEQTANGRLTDKNAEENNISNLEEVHNAPKTSTTDHQPATDQPAADQPSTVKLQNHVCPHCYFSCISLEDYRVHLLANTKTHGCVSCSKTLSKKLAFSDHEYCHPQPEQYNCFLCSCVLESEESFEEHIKSVHADGTKSKPLPCCTCGQNYEPSQFLEHVKVCRRKHAEWDGRKRLEKKTCQTCNKVFRRVGALRRHIKLHDAGHKRQLDCTSCGRTFRHGGAYAKHISANPGHGPAVKGLAGLTSSANFVCEFCGRTFSKREGLKIHLMRHSGVKPYSCTNCPKAFLSRYSLLIHVRQHTGERPYMCEVCGKNFTGPTSLYVHQRAHRLRNSREEEKKSASQSVKHVCPVCGKVLSSKLVFEGHVRQHTGERPFTCSVCGKGFTTMKIMKMHVKRHEIRKKMQLQKVTWVEEEISEVVAGEGSGLDGNSGSGGACIFLCPKCGVGLLSPEELEDHMAGGDCPGGGSEMFVLPMNNNIECMETENVVELMENSEPHISTPSEIIDGGV